MTNFQKFGYIIGQGRYHEEIIYSMALIYNVIKSRITTYLRPYHLTIGKLNILLVIKHQAGIEGIKQIDISHHLIVTPSNMTKMIDKLETDDLVLRNALSGDRRVNIVTLTEKGKQLIDDLWEGYNKILLEEINK